ncbi:hypothetical protein BMI91_13780 [Thioclava sediminum]|uniref:Uncharacterized protein n=1 Tax=Thioclava sediminum TaxID=1915319 RepID=A0ABX3MV30_9RHOB|nr:hypothetical protein [Thioclava sediminum]OOY23548.1 hypothetical protein BMI91_13780 [Thioclava sediminum]
MRHAPVSALRGVVFCLAAAVSAGPALAQSALGFTGAELTIENSTGDFGAARADLSADFALTPAHGLQLDLGANDAGPRWRGDLAAHLYMAPTERAKYGLFAAVSDTSHASQTAYAAGAEAIWAVGARGSVSARAVLGTVKPGSNDYVFAGLAGRWDISPRTTLTADLSVVDISELAFSARETTAALGIGHRLGDGPATLFTRIERAHFTGRPDSRDETRLALGLTVRFGPRGHGVRNQSFAPIRPLDGLFARGTFALN